MIYPLHTEYPSTSFLAWFIVSMVGFVSVMMAFYESAVLWVAAGVSALACIIYTGRALAQYTPILNRDSMATRHQDAEFRPCVACGEPFDGGNGGTAHHLMKNYDYLGTASVHHRPDCLTAGLVMVEENASEANAHYIRAVHRIGGETFRYDMIVDGGFGFELSNDNKVNRWTLDFLRWYVENDGLVLVKFGGTDNRGESGRQYDRIPMLLPVTTDIVKDAVSNDDSYAKRRREARAKMRRSLSMRCGEHQQCMIMSQYARDTALTARSDQKAVKPAAPHG